MTEAYTRRMTCKIPSALVNRRPIFSLTLLLKGLLSGVVNLMLQQRKVLDGLFGGLFFTLLYIFPPWDHRSA